MLKKTYKIIFVNLLIFILLIILLEIFLIGVRYFTSTEDRPRPFLGFLYDFRKTTLEKKNILKNDCLRMRTHQFYDVTHDHNGKCEILNGEIYGSFVHHENNENFPNLITLGGSTTDGFYEEIYGKVWPSHLNDNIVQNNIHLNVINGGNGDFGSSQELLKLLIDVGNIKNVKYVLSLSGINDMQGRNKYLRFQNKYPFWTNVNLEMFIYEKWINQSIISSRYLPNILSLVSALKRRMKEYNNLSNELYQWEEALNSKNTQDRNSIQDWLYNVKMMNSISQSMGAKFFLFLQPTMGISDAQTPKDESSKNYKIYDQLEEDYYIRVKNHYNELRILCSKLEFCYDVSDIATAEKDVYFDARHHNEKGNKIIAEEIFQIIFGY